MSDLNSDRSLAIVTGASSGIGREIARQLAAKGLDILAIARREHRLTELKGELELQHGVTVFPLVADLSAQDVVQQIYAEVIRIGQPVKWLVNNAGYTENMDFAGTPWDEHRAFLDVLLMVPVALTHRLIPLLKEASRAYVLNISSTAAFTPGTIGMALYPSSKTFIHYFTQGLAVQLKKYGIQATVSFPGMTATELIDNWDGADLDKSKMMSPEQVASEAIEAAEQGKPAIIHGTADKILCYLFRILPQAGRTYILNKMVG